MLALVHSEDENCTRLHSDWPIPIPGPQEALVKVSRAGVCSTDLEITRGYIPGYHQVLGHEFVGTVQSVGEGCGDAGDAWVGRRVVGEINCNCAGFRCADSVFQRNHAPGRTVLGIIDKDGAMAEYLTLPVENLHAVPDMLSDREACYAEPLAAACRVVEQKLLEETGVKSIAVIGDGKLGLLVAQVLACHAPPGSVTLFGRHLEKMKLVQGVAARQVVDQATATAFAGQFDIVVEASGSASGVRTALALTRPLGTIVLKTTVSAVASSGTGSGTALGWSEIANDLVVNEKRLVGSRCGPVNRALQLLVEHQELRQLVNDMTAHELPAGEAKRALQLGADKGVLKVQITFAGDAGRP